VLLPQWQFERRHDARPGYDELAVRARG
jgi:hypothetical protein